MIVRIATEGQYELPDADADRLNDLDNEVVAAIDAGDEERFHELFESMLQLVRSESRLLMAVQIGAAVTDAKVFRFAIDGKGRVSFMDARGEDDYKPPRRHPFEWTQARREDQVAGPFPHINVLNEVFVETIGGDLTVKIENNTQDGLGVYREPVDDPNQTLDDADIARCRKLDTKLAHFTIDCNATALEANRRLFHDPGIGLPDPVAMAVALEPGIATRTSRHAVEIECDSPLTRGMTVVDSLDVVPRQLGDPAGWPDAAVSGPPNATVVWQIDVARFKERLFRALA